MLEWIKNLMDSLGYIGIVCLMFLENIFPPLPSEVIMPLAGFTAARGDLTFVGVVLAGTLGSVIGALPLYYLGRVVGEERLKQWFDRYGAWLTVSGKEIEHADQWFERHGHKAVFIGRLVPGVRSLISIPAGISGMNLVQFLLYSAAGALIWTAVLAYLGRLLGQNYERVNTYLGPITYVVLGGLLIAGIIWVIKRKKQRATSDERA